MSNVDSKAYVIVFVCFDIVNRLKHCIKYTNGNKCQLFYCRFKSLCDFVCMSWNSLEI